jgi:hypothetical protein
MLEDMPTDAELCLDERERAGRSSCHFHDIAADRRRTNTFVMEVLI